VLTYIDCQVSESVQPINLLKTEFNGDIVHSVGCKSATTLLLSRRGNISNQVSHWHWLTCS